MTFVVFLDMRGKWHCNSISGYYPDCKFFDKIASKVVKTDAHIAQVCGFTPLDTIATFAIHASSRQYALKLAKECYEARLEAKLLKGCE